MRIDPKDQEANREEQDNRDYLGLPTRVD